MNGRANNVMFQRLRSTLLTVSACSFLWMGSANATTITSTTFNGWKTSLTGNPTEADFGAVQYTNYNTSSGLTLDAIGNSSIQFNVSGPDNGAYSLSGVNYSGFKSLEGPSDSGSSMYIATPAGGDNALLISFATTNNTPVYISLSDGEFFTESSGVLGLSISHPITGVNLSTSSGSQVVLDDLWFGMSSLTQDGSTSPGSAIPEGATLLMMSGGLLVVFGTIKRLRGLSETTLA